MDFFGSNKSIISHALEVRAGGVSIDFFSSNKCIIAQALEIWVDRIKYGHCTPEYKEKINDLSDDQVEFIDRLNELKNDIIFGTIDVR